METSSEGLNVDNYFESMELTGQECRLCMVKSDSVLELFQNHHEIPRKIMACAAVQVIEGDGLPTIICYTCRRLLDVSYEFKCQVEKSDSKFRQFMELKPQLTDYNTMQHSLAESVNQVITEAIADEITLHRTETPIELPLESPVRSQSPEELSNHIEEHSTVDPMTVDIDITRETNNIVEKIEQYIETRSIDEDVAKDETTCLAEESELSDEDQLYQEDIFNDSRVLKNDDNMESTIIDGKLDEHSDEEKPLSSRTPRQKCPHCIKTFVTKSALQRHEILHNRKDILSFVCYMCDHKFPTMLKLKNHVLSTHDSLKNEDKSSVSENEISESEEKTGKTKDVGESKDSKFACKYCSKQFIYEKHFLTHAKRHREYQEELSIEEESKEHKYDSEDDDMPREGLQCTQCGKLFATKRNLKRHLSTHEGLRFNCNSCDKEFSRLDKLKEHDQIKHQDDLFEPLNENYDGDTDNDKKNNESESAKKEKHSRPHKCPMCPKGFAQVQSLNNHMERHKRVKDTQKRFLCEVCSKCFAQSGSLVAHMRTHTGVKPYVCNVCSRAFTKSTYLQLHMRTHSGEKPYICQYCSRAFARANTLARHITMHTGEAKYHCQICMKSFRRLTSLNEHTYTHTGQRPYACKICTKRYNNAGSLYAHTKKCKAQQLTNDAFAMSSDETNNQNGSSSASMAVYSQRKLTEEPAINQATNTQFVISNVHSQKPLTSNVQSFTVEESNLYTVNAKPFKNPYYTIYPNM